MHATEERVRLVLVSPGDVARERAVVSAVVDELNRAVAADRGCQLSLWRWETHSRTGMHLQGPQGLIDELMEIEDADIVVGLFWKYFGTPTHESASGTEHELRRAWAAWRERGRPEVMVYFCRRAYAPRAPAELAQWQRVLEFQRDLPKEQLWWTYSTIHEFERLLREHLTRLVQSRSPRREPGPVRRTGAYVRFNLPPLAAAFTGRDEELDALDDALAVADRAVITQAITGLGGVGKSQLAARYIQQRIDRYDIVAWIRAEDGGIADLAQLAAKLGAPVEGLSPSERAQAAVDWLGTSEEHWLLILDNIESPLQLKALLPRSGSGRVLVTSRDRALREFGPVLTVDVFDEDTATKYLIERADRPRDEAAARDLAAAVGCLPLALSHAAAYCQTGTSFADYLKLLGELPARELFDSHPELSYVQTVASTWKASIEAASNDAPLAADVLAMAAHLGPDAIPKSLFNILVDANTPAGRHRLSVALNTLARFSLATVDDDSFSVHRLLQKIIREDSAVRDDQTAALRALSAVNNAFPSDVELPTHWPLCERLLSHALALTDTLKRPGDASPQLIGLLNRACNYLNRAEPGQRGLSITRTTLWHAERVLGTEHPDTLFTRHYLAEAYLEDGGGVNEAIAILESLLADRQRICGTEHPDTLATRNDLARSYIYDSRYREAIAILEPLLADCQRILGAEHPGTLSTCHYLAETYLEDGRVGEALTMMESLLADRQRIFGAEHPDTLFTRNNLARAYFGAGRVDEAIAIFKSLVADRERIFGAGHPATLRTRSNLGRAYLNAGRIDQAIAIFEPLLADRRRILGAEYPATLRTHNRLGRAYLEAGRVGEAIAIFEPLLTDQERIHGPEHPYTLCTCQSLARSYLVDGRSDDAERLLKRAGLAEA
jgi:tetratricopeptide (TPR) repeat protein